MQNRSTMAPSIKNISITIFWYVWGISFTPSKFYYPVEQINADSSNSKNSSLSCKMGAIKILHCVCATLVYLTYGYFELFGSRLHSYWNKDNSVHLKSNCVTHKLFSCSV